MGNNNIFIYGGNKDFNILNILDYMRNNNIKHSKFIHVIGSPIDVSFDLNNNIFLINGVVFDAKMVFMRHDVFAYLETNDPHYNRYAENMYNLLKQFIVFNKDIKTVNRRFLEKGNTYKIFNLLKAQEVGFLIPETLISSNLETIETFSRQFECIQKPILGGEHAKPIAPETLHRYHNNFAMPHKIQKRMLHPEIRVYRIHDVFLSFHIAYEGIDYRVHNKTDISVVENDISICQKLKALTDYIGLDYAAADFMTDEDGNLRFLEVNSFPMFAAFDKVSNFGVSKAIIDFLHS